MKLSSMREGEVGKLKGEKFIVVNRCPEDRCSGVTTIAYDNGSRKDFVWDYEDPEVEFIGRGKLMSSIIMEK